MKYNVNPSSGSADKQTDMKELVGEERLCVIAGLFLPNGTTQLPLHGLSRKFVLGAFFKICRENLGWVNPLNTELNPICQ